MPDFDDPSVVFCNYTIHYQVNLLAFGVPRIVNCEPQPASVFADTNALSVTVDGIAYWWYRGALLRLEGGNWLIPREAAPAAAANPRETPA